jgi:flagellar biosynthesis chaperone FliJ
MRKRPKYPLEQVAVIKQKRLEEAEKLLKEKKEALTKEETNLTNAIAKRDKVLEHKKEKIRKHLEEMEAGTTSDKIQLAERYIKKVVEEDLKREEKKVKDQREVVKKAQKAVEDARELRLKKNQEVEKMRLHRKEWEKEQTVIEMQEENLEMDELGSSMFVRKRKK